MIKLIITGLIIGIFLIPTFSFATTSAAFLTMPISAKEAALGGAFVAVNREMNAVSYNPAGMSKFDGFGGLGRSRLILYFQGLSTLTLHKNII